MLGYTGVLFRQHLNKGVAKGAFSQEEADKRYDAWVAEKANKIQGKVDRLAKESSDAASKALKHEKEVNENRLKAMTAAAEEASNAAKAAAEEAAAPVAAEAPAAEEASAADTAENTEA